MARGWRALAPPHPRALTRVRVRAAPAPRSEPRVAVFVVETVENAQPAEAAGALVRHFNRRRKEAAPGAAPLAGLLRFAVLGLGDTNLLLDRQTTTAKDCNQAAAALDGALRALGAAPMCARGEANDAVGLHAAVEPWAAALWPKLAALKAALSQACQGEVAEGLVYYLGAKSAIGLGRVAMRWSGSIRGIVAPALNNDTSLMPANGPDWDTDYTAHLRDHRDDILRLLEETMH